MRRKARIDQETYDQAKLLLGVPLGQPSLEVGTAISCAFDMGYRTPDSIARMARQLIAGPPERAVSSSPPTAKEP